MAVLIQKSERNNILVYKFRVTFPIKAINLIGLNQYFGCPTRDWWSETTGAVLVLNVQVSLCLWKIPLTRSSSQAGVALTRGELCAPTVVGLHPNLSEVVV